MQKHIKHAGEKGFTLIELLIVIAIIGFLAAAVLVAVDPVKRIQDSRDARRFSEANAILNAILTKQVDDRKIFNGLSTAPILTHVTNAQVIVTNDAGIECDTATVGVTNDNFPGCSATIDNSARLISGTASSSGTVITGIGTNFLSTLRIGDVVTDLTATDSCTILSITSDLVATCTANPSPGAFSAEALRIVSKNCVANLGGKLLVTATSSGVTVTTSSAYTSSVAIGDVLLSASGGSCTVTALPTAVTITCATAPSPVFAGAVFNTTKSMVPNYIASAPLDPRGSGSSMCDGTNVDCTIDTVDAGTADVSLIGEQNTGYYIHRTNGNRIEIGSCAGEQLTATGAISVKR